VICWDRCGFDVVGYFDEFEIDVLRGYADHLLRLVADRTSSYECFAGAMLPTEATADARLLALLRAEVGMTEPDWVLTCQEAWCLNEVVDQVRAQRATLPESGGLVTFHLDSASTWIQVIHWYLAVVVAVTDDSGCAMGKSAAPTIGWLTGIVEGLEERLRG
jgi:hypothetical protein